MPESRIGYGRLVAEAHIQFPQIGQMLETKIGYGGLIAMNHIQESQIR